MWCYLITPHWTSRKTPGRPSKRCRRSSPSSILVEREIGDIGTGSEIHEEAASVRSLTSAFEGKKFVEATGGDILAPAMGNAHGVVRSMVVGDTAG
jgi:fructose/tagatose bisphosphate aldolase